MLPFKVNICVGPVLLGEPDAARNMKKEHYDAISAHTSWYGLTTQCGRLLQEPTNSAEGQPLLEIGSENCSGIMQKPF